MGRYLFKSFSGFKKKKVGGREKRISAGFAKCKLSTGPL